MQVAKRSCPICRAVDVRKLHAQKFSLPEGHPLADGYDVVCCNSCGFVYADTVVPQEEYDRFYAQYSKYEDAQTGTGGVENPWDRKRQEETAHQISEYLKNQSLSILDVGCANGGLLKSLKDIGYANSFGIDPSPACVANTRKLGVEAEIGSLFQSLSKEPFDCVVLSHTLEHVQDLHDATKWINQNLKPGGLVYIETPDATRYMDFIYAPFQDFNTEHINHFSLTCLRNLMQLHGLGFLHGNEKDLKADIDIHYPAIFGFWEKAGNVITHPIEKDIQLDSRIREYIGRSKEMMRRIDTQIARILTSSSSVIVWGTGQLAMKLLAESALAQANIIAFVDNNPINHGKILRGIPILAPKALNGSDIPILIATLLHHRSIAKQIREMGLKNEIVFLQGESE